MDTSVAIELRDGNPAVIEKIDGLGGVILMSVVTRVELENGVYRTKIGVQERRARLEPILASIPTLPFDRADVEMYARIVSEVGYSRRKLLDRMIAAQALVQNATLITLNAADFADVPGLHILEW